MIVQADDEGLEIGGMQLCCKLLGRDEARQATDADTVENSIGRIVGLNHCQPVFLL